MKKFVVNCDFGGQMAPFAVYIGVPEGGHHPLHFQGDWLSKNRGGSIPPNIMDAVGKLKDIAVKNKVSLEELCVYALGAAQQEKDQGNLAESGADSEELDEEDLNLDDLFDDEDDDIVMSNSDEDSSEDDDLSEDEDFGEEDDLFDYEDLDTESPDSEKK